MSILASSYTAETGRQTLFSHKKTQAQQSSGNELVDHTTKGSARPVQPGRCYTFDGVDDHITVPDVSAMDFKDTDFTVSFWVYIDSTGTSTVARVISKASVGVGGWEVFIDQTNGRVYLRTVSGGTQANSYAIFNRDQWIHVAVVRSGTSAIFYQNGVLLTPAQSATHTGVVSNTTTAYIGRYQASATGYLKGLLHSLSVHSGALTITDIQAQYAGTYSATNMKLFLRMDEGSGTVAYTSCGNTYHGTLVNGVAHTTLTNGSGADYQNQVGYSNGVNLTSYSEDILNAFWSKSGSSIGSSSTICNSITAYLLSETATTLEHSVYKSFSITGGQTYTFSTYIKKGTVDKTQLYAVTAGFSNGFYANFNLTSGTVNTSGFYGNGSITSSSITAVGDGYRISITGIISTGSTTGYMGVTTLDDTYTRVHLGVITDNIYVGGLQFESGTITSYQKAITEATSGKLIPRNLANTTQDIFGNTLQYAGRVPYNSNLVQSNALTLNGTTQSILVPNISGWQELVVGWEFECYLSVVDYTAGRTVYSQYKNTINHQLIKMVRVDVTTGILSVFIASSTGGYNTWSTGYVVPTNTAVKIRVVVNTDRTTYLYVNDVLYGSTTFANYSTTPDLTVKSYIGTTDGVGTYFSGAIWGVKLTNTTTGLKAQYPISEGTGATIYDVSGNGNHGTAINSPTWTTQNTYHYNLTKGFTTGRNTAKYSEELTGSGWVATSVTVAGGYSDPFGGTKAYLCTPSSTNSLLYQALPIANRGAGTTFTFSAWIKSATGSDVIFAFSTNGTGAVPNPTVQTVTATTTWQRVSKTFTTDEVNNINFIFGLGNSWATGENIYIYGVQIEPGSTTTAYQPTTGSGNLGAKVPATLSGYIPNGFTDLVSNPAGNYHNGAETKANRNPIGAKELVNYGIAKDTLIDFSSLGALKRDTNGIKIRNVRS